MNIVPMPTKRYMEIIKRCRNRISTVESLVNGNISENVKDVFVSDRGLFHRPGEISFQYICPNWAYMCKHVVAVLYGIGESSTRIRCCSSFSGASTSSFSLEKP